MGKFKIGIKFDKKFLTTLTKEPDSGVEKQTAKHHLAVHPRHLNDFNESVKDLLNAGIAKYNKNLDGILLGYHNIKLVSDMGVICNDSPYLHYDFLVDFFVFKPEIGKEMRGVVNRISKDHVGLLVYNTFNVSIPQPKDDEDWLGTSVNVGDDVTFKIVYIDLNSYLPYIRGELVDVVSQNNDVENSGKVSKNKKIIFKDEENLEIPVSKKRKLDDSSESEVKLKKLKKKIKTEPKEDLSEMLNISDLINESVNSDNTPTKKKSKKKKKEQ